MAAKRPSFMILKLEKAARKLGIKQRTAIAYTPKSNENTERTVAAIRIFMKNSIMNSGLSWDQIMSRIFYSYQTENLHWTIPFWASVRKSFKYELRGKYFTIEYSVRTFEAKRISDCWITETLESLKATENERRDKIQQFQNIWQRIDCIFRSSM